MNNTIIALVAAILLGLAACRWQGIRGNGHIVTDQRTVGDFSEIEASGTVQIDWRSGPPSFAVTTDENIVPSVRTEVADKKLRIRSEGEIWTTHGIKVAISSPTRIAARLSGATRLTANQLSGDRFAVESSGATRVSLDGKVDELLADMTGASRLEAESLQSRIAEISTTGAGKAEVNASDTLKVSITGAGKVVYSGHPTNIEKSISGAGKIQHKD